MNIFKNIYNYRELLKTTVKKDIRGRYKNSFLGVIWSFFNHVSAIVIEQHTAIQRSDVRITYAFLCVVWI